MNLGVTALNAVLRAQAEEHDSSEPALASLHGKGLRFELVQQPRVEGVSIDLALQHIEVADHSSGADSPFPLVVVPNPARALRTVMSRKATMTTTTVTTHTSTEITTTTTTTTTAPEPMDRDRPSSAEEMAPLFRLSYRRQLERQDEDGHTIALELHLSPVLVRPPCW